MRGSYDATLASRLKNCLVTILELEELLADSRLGPALEQEFSTLKVVVAHLEEIRIAEDDVARIERATMRFLSELQGSVQEESLARKTHERLLQ